MIPFIQNSRKCKFIYTSGKQSGSLGIAGGIEEVKGAGGNL